MTIRVLLADDQALVRGGFRMILDVGGRHRGRGRGERRRRGGRASSSELEPDVVLMDVRMPDVDGIEATRRIVASGSEARVVVLTTYDADEYVFAALRAGASGFLLKDVRPVELIEAIRVVARGDALLAPTVTRRLLDRLTEALPETDAAAGRPRPAHRARARGACGSSHSDCRTRRSRQRLVVTEATVKTHVSSVLRKLRLRDRVQAVVLAYDLRLVRPALTLK